MTEMMMTPRASRRLFRRISDAGAGTLMRAVIEHAGTPVPFQDGLRYEARILSTFFFLQSTSEGWFIPADLAAVMAPVVSRERFFAGSLLARLDRSDVIELLDEYDVSRSASPATQIHDLREAIAATTQDDDDLRKAAATTAELGLVEARDIDSVELVHGSGALQLRVTVDDETYTVTPREVAERLGFAFEPAEYDGREAPEWTGGRAGNQFQYARIGGLVTFSTGRTAQDAMAVPAFAEQVHERLDERRVALRVGANMSVVNAELDRLGFLKQDTKTKHTGTYASN